MLKIYDKSRYQAKLKRHFYETEVILDLNKKVNELKEMVYEQTKIPIDRQIFYLNGEILSDDWKFSQFGEENIFETNIEIGVSKQLNDVIYVEYPNSEIREITTDLSNTGFELLKELDNNYFEMNHGFNLKYNLIHGDKKLNLNNLLLNEIQNKDVIKLKKRNTVQIILSSLHSQKSTFNVELTDTVGEFKSFVELTEGVPFYPRMLIHAGRQLEDGRTFASYNIQGDSTIQTTLRLRGG